MFPSVGLALSLAQMNLWLHFQEGLWMKQTVPHRAKSLSLFCILLDCPWQVKGQGFECKRCTEACQRVNLSVGQRPRTRKGQDEVLCYTKQALLTPSRTWSCLSWNPAVTQSLDLWSFSGYRKSITSYSAYLHGTNIFGMTCFNHFSESSNVYW